MQVKYDNCDFTIFSYLIQKYFGAKILLEVFSVLSWQGPVEVIKGRIVLLDLRRACRRDEEL